MDSARHGFSPDFIGLRTTNEISIMHEIWTPNRIDTCNIGVIETNYDPVNMPEICRTR